MNSNLNDYNVSNISRIKSFFNIIDYLPYKYKRKLLYSITLVIIAGILESQSIRFIRITLDQLTLINESEFINNFSNNIYF